MPAGGRFRAGLLLCGRNHLDNLILIYDSNDVTLDAMANASQSEDTAKRYEAYGWHVQTINGHDFDAIASALKFARETKGKPHLIVARTLIGKGISEVAGTAKAHGEGGAKFIDAARKGLGLPEHEHFLCFCRNACLLRCAPRGNWLRLTKWKHVFAAWQAAHPELAQLYDGVARKTPSEQELLAAIPHFAADSKIATRKAGSDVLQPVAQAIPLAVSGSADLYGSTLNYINGAKDAPADFAGRNIRYGIREHAMAAIMNGMAYDGIFHASGATFLVFADYARPYHPHRGAPRVAVVYIFTHDSVGVGEDGPTHPTCGDGQWLARDSESSRIQPAIPRKPRVPLLPRLRARTVRRCSPCPDRRFRCSMIFQWINGAKAFCTEPTSPNARLERFTPFSWQAAVNCSMPWPPQRHWVMECVWFLCLAWKSSMASPLHTRKRFSPPQCVVAWRLRPG
jgi:transketolase